MLPSFLPGVQATLLLHTDVKIHLETLRSGDEDAWPFELSPTTRRPVQGPIRHLLGHIIRQRLHVHLRKRGKVSYYREIVCHNGADCAYSFHKAFASPQGQSLEADSDKVM